MSVVIPLFNEEDNVEPLVREFVPVVERLPGLEVCLVDDGSSDSTWQRIRQAGTSHPFVHGLHYEPNKGQSHAMLMGLRAARGDVLITMDGDMQNNPADIPALVAALDDCDAVCGYRASRKDTWSRRIGSRLANRVRNWVTHDGMRDTGCSLKAFRRDCAGDLPPLRGVHRFMPAYFVLNGRRIKEVPVDHRARERGVSKYTNMKRLPQTLFDLFGFLWYRRRYQRPSKPVSTETDRN